ncbi:MAG: c-type cytochrome [Gammaproteobacteria bacterium]|nr:c-type cytochrome [Gammaproteobacteria bacterium]
MKYPHAAVCLLMSLIVTSVAAGDPAAGVPTAGTPAAGAPVASSPESIARGKSLYLQHCTSCHGKDGRSLVDVISDATDLTDPEAYYSGSSDREIFTSIRDGAGVSMPPFSFQIKDEKDIWNLVNFIHSLWPVAEGE